MKRCLAKLNVLLVFIFIAAFGLVCPCDAQFKGEVPKAKKGAVKGSVGKRNFSKFRSSLRNSERNRRRANAERFRKVGSKLERQSAKKLRSTRNASAPYDPVLGYEAIHYKVAGRRGLIENVDIRDFDKQLWQRNPSGQGGLRPTTKGGTVLVQTEPVRHTADMAVEVSAAFEPIDNVGTRSLTQAVYLWRLKHKGAGVQSNKILSGKAKQIVRKFRKYNVNPAELPLYMFLERLYNPAAKVKSYAQLLEETKTYPKHVTLDEAGFPVRTPQAEQAAVLDNYLMVSHPSEMGRYNNMGREYGMPPEGKVGKNATEYGAGYEGLRLTKEEQAAADQLLQLRQESFSIPQNPTPRQLLELAYNQLESHTAGLDDAAYINDPDMMFQSIYPNYANTKLGKTIKGMVKEALYRSRGYDVDMAHLIVLDGVMSKMSIDPYMDQGILQAFDQLCRQTPFSAERAMHLNTLRKALLRGKLYNYTSHAGLFHGFTTDISPIRSGTIGEFVDPEVSPVFLDFLHLRVLELEKMDIYQRMKR